MEHEALQPYLDYISSFERMVPKELYGIMDELLIIMSIIIVCMIMTLGWRSGLRYTARMVLVAYVMMIFGLAVFFRPDLPERQLILTPFWSYNQDNLEVEKVMNLVLFIPVGLCLCVGFRNVQCKMMLLGGFALSLSVEVLQFILVKGCTEIDDLIHNTLGCVIGMLSVKALNKIVRRPAV